MHYSSSSCIHTGSSHLLFRVPIQLGFLIVAQAILSFSFFLTGMMPQQQQVTPQFHSYIVECSTILHIEREVLMHVDEAFHNIDNRIYTLLLVKLLFFSSRYSHYSLIYTVFTLDYTLRLWHCGQRMSGAATRNSLIVKPLVRITWPF